MMRGYNPKAEDYLFNTGDWSATSEAWRKKLSASIEGMNSDELLSTSTTDLAKYYAVEYTFDVPQLLEEELVVDQREVQIDVSQDRNVYISNRNSTFYVPGTSVDVEIPFSGNKVGFELRASTYSSNAPRAYVDAQHLSFSITGRDLSTDRVKAEIDSRIDSIKQHLEWLASCAKGYNENLYTLAETTIENRKNKLLKAKSLLAGLGYNMKVRPGENQTYAAPKVRRKIRPATRKPVPSSQPFKPEPILTGDDYEHILTIMENMVGVMEKSPGAFRDSDEESLRSHFLMQLNGHFEGDATGETFNYEGKTDIHIKVDEKNIFIGECKFWSGESGYIETLDQVLSYLSWRDTKAAVLIFNRNKNFTSVLEKIEQSTGTHPNFKKLAVKRSETSWTYLFGHKDDSNREITITVQAYNVPDRIQPRLGNN